MSEYKKCNTCKWTFKKENMIKLSDNNYYCEDCALENLYNEGNLDSTIY